MKVPQPPPDGDEGTPPVPPPDVPPPDGDEEDLQLWEVEQKATERIFEKIASTGTVVYRDERRDQRQQERDERQPNKKPEQRYLARWWKEADGKLVPEEPAVARQYVDSPLVLSQWSRNNRLMKERLKILLQGRKWCKGLRLFTAKCGECGEVSLEDIPARLKEFHRRIAKLAGSDWAKQQKLHFLLRKTELPVVTSRKKDLKAVVLLHAHMVVQCREKLEPGQWKELREHVKKKLGPGHDAAVRWSDKDGLERLLWYLFKNPLASRKRGKALVDKVNALGAGKPLSKSIPDRQARGSSLKYDALCDLPAESLKMLLQQLKNQHLVSPMGAFRLEYRTVKGAAKQSKRKPKRKSSLPQQGFPQTTAPDTVLGVMLGKDGNRGRAVIVRPSGDKSHLATNLAAAIKSKLAPAPPRKHWELVATKYMRDRITTFLNAWGTESFTTAEIEIDDYDHNLINVNLAAIPWLEQVDSKLGKNTCWKVKFGPDCPVKPLPPPTFSPEQLGGVERNYIIPGETRSLPGLHRAQKAMIRKALQEQQSTAQQEEQATAPLTKG